jgi:hypothetical protein
MLDLNEIVLTVLKPNQAFSIKTTKGTFYTIYIKETLLNAINNGSIDLDNDLVYIRRIA